MGPLVTDSNQDLLGAFAEQYLDYLSGACEEPPVLAGLDAKTQREANAVRRLLRAAWRAADEYIPPPLHDDPLAIALGLIPDPARRLDGRKLAQARKARGMRPSQLADRLAARGWDTRTNALVRWELATGIDIAPALLIAIAEVLSVPAERLVSTSSEHSAAAKEVDAAAAAPRFADLAARWAAKAGLSMDAARNTLRQTMVVATARRGDHLKADEWLIVLERLIETGDGEEGQP